MGLVGSAPDLALVREVDLDVRAGEIVALVGESGSGKSLTALSMLGLLPSSLSVLGGEIRFDGIDLTKLPEQELHSIRGQQIGVVFQDPLNALNPTLTIGKQLANVIIDRTRCSRRAARQRAVEALVTVGITSPEERMDLYPHQLSGGMRQRVLIAMTIVGPPRLILADEPTTALDVTVQARIVEMLRRIRDASNVAIVFISHNLDLVAEFCQRIAVMYGGRVMEEGTSVQIVTAARHPYTRALLACIPRIDAPPGPLTVIPGQSPANPGLIVGCPFAERCVRAVSACSEGFPRVSDLGEGHRFACWNPFPEAQAVDVG